MILFGEHTGSEYQASLQLPTASDHFDMSWSLQFDNPSVPAHWYRAAALLEQYAHTIRCLGPGELEYTLLSGRARGDDPRFLKEVARRQHLRACAHRAY